MEDEDRLVQMAVVHEIVCDRSFHWPTNHITFQEKRWLEWLDILDSFDSQPTVCFYDVS